MGVIRWFVDELVNAGGADFQGIRRPKHSAIRPLKVTRGQVGKKRSEISQCFFSKVRDEQDRSKNQRRLILYVGDSGDETKQLFQTQSSNDDLENCCTCFFVWINHGFLLCFCSFGCFFCFGCFEEIVVFAAVSGVLWDGFKQSTFFLG